MEAQGEGALEGPHGRAREGPRKKRRRARNAERKEVVAAAVQVGAAPASEAVPRWRSLVVVGRSRHDGSSRKGAVQCE